jgi:DNA-binding response OmpR family regulator
MIKIAHIDDDHNFGFLFWTMVQVYNATVTEDEDMIVLDSYRDGKHFWDVFTNDSEEYDLVVLDITLGNENGYDIAQKIYDNSTHTVLPVVIMLSSHILRSETFASLIAKHDIKMRDIVRRFKMLSRDANHRNMTDVLLRSEDYSNHIAHA